MLNLREYRSTSGSPAAPFLPRRQSGRRILRIAVCCILFPSSSPASGQPGIAITATTPDGWTLAYAPLPRARSPVVIDGETSIRFEGGVGQPGFPLLPVDVFTLGIPSHASLTVEMLDPVFETTEGQLVAPAPEQRIDANGEAIDTFRIDRHMYSQFRFLPEQQVVVEPVYTLRHQRVATVRLFPLQYNPATRTLRRLLHGTLRVTLTGGGDAETTDPAGSDPAFEPVYRALLLNYEQARQWRVRSAQGPSDSTGDWFETGREYCRLSIARDGWYRVTPADIMAAGGEGSSIDPATLRVFCGGVEIPIVVRPDTSVGFHALRNRRATEGAGAFTDTAAYWLTWGGVPGLRFSPSPQPPGGGDPPAASARTLVRFEQNAGYFTGTTQAEVMETGDVPGEGWYWERIYPNTTVLVPFFPEDLAGEAHRISLRVRLFSMTPDSPAVDHHARFWVNDSLLGEAMFEGRTGMVFTDSFPSSWLRPDSNILRISSVATPTVPNLFYLDWFEVGFLKSLHAQENMLAVEATPVTGTVAFRASGFSTPELEVRDIPGGRELTGGTLLRDSSGGYTLVFRDSLSGIRAYDIVGRSAGLRPPLIVAKRFANIRTRPVGADYLIITHRLFSRAAARLAAHRSSFSGVRTAVIDIQDIYDEFAYGVADPAAIRLFLRHAFEHWSAPAPATVLLLGDASWDPRGYLSTSVMRDFVPSRGVPAGDNWFVAFDSTPVPSMAIGRLPVQDSLQALRVVEKIIRFDAQPTGLWNKNFLMITGGTSPGEQQTFNARSESVVNAALAPPPIGGTIFRAYKSSDAVVDGEYREKMRALVRDGLAFLNFLGHSGGRVWGVDIGDPATLENTDGRLPFVCSVSCNIAAFAEPSGNVLAENFVLADNRAAVAAWASSSLGYPTAGTQLVHFLFAAVREDSLRELGLLTTLARLRLYQTDAGDPVVRAMTQLNPLLGDPLTRLPIPLQPDLALDESSLQITPGPAETGEEPATVRLVLHNFGLVPAESVEVHLTDQFNGVPHTLLRRKVGPVFHSDSLAIPWRAEPGGHRIEASVDPSDIVRELSEGNNTASREISILANRPTLVRPIRSQVVPSGSVTLVAASSPGEQQRPRLYEFELDTAGRFSPPAVSSGPVAAGPVCAQWETPPLETNRVWFWRVRAADGTTPGTWAVSSFSSSAEAPHPPVVRVRQHTGPLFEQNLLEHVTATDSGLVLAPASPTELFVRSLGSRADPASEYYSMIRLGDVAFLGLWGEIGGGFMALRVDGLTGEHEFRAFNVPSDPIASDSLAAFLESTPEGDYLAVVAILDGHSNVRPSLLAALASLGSSSLAGVAPGMSWAFSCRRGTPGSMLEGASNDSVSFTREIRRISGSGRGAMLVGRFAASTLWDTLRWETTLRTAVTDARALFLGRRRDTGTDTLMEVSPATRQVSLGPLSDSAATARYTEIQLVFALSTQDPEDTPLLREWSIDMRPPADIALGYDGAGRDTAVERGTVFSFPVRVENIGYATARRVPLTASSIDDFLTPHQFGRVVLDSLPAGSAWTTAFPLPTEHLPPRAVLVASVWGDSAGADLIDEDNTCRSTITILGPPGSQVRILADGRMLMEGDYVGPRPEISLDLPESGDSLMMVGGAVLTANGRDIPAESTGRGERRFRPLLADGAHVLEIRVYREGPFYRDTLMQRVGVHVESNVRIKNLYPYPNPFDRATEFVFTLTGSERPEEAVISVYTVAGRRIREIRVPGPSLGVGFNRVGWDGRDQEGDDVANGTYLYRLVVRGVGGRSESATGKLARVR